MNNLIDLLSNSRLTILGYTYKNERIKDELISSISSIRLNDNFSSNSFLQLLRDKKISNLLNNEESSKFITFDLLDIKRDKRSWFTSQTRTKDLDYIKSILPNNHSLVISAPFYKGIDNEDYIKGGNSNMYIADLVLYIEDDKKLKVIKSRQTDKYYIYV